MSALVACACFGRLMYFMRKTVRRATIETACCMQNSTVRGGACLGWRW